MLFSSTFIYEFSANIINHFMVFHMPNSETGTYADISGITLVYISVYITSDLSLS